jgi:hypothetical protein
MMGDRRSVLVPYHREEAMSVNEAAEFAGRSPSTIRAWCEEYPIARKIVAGNWAISRVALHMLLNEDWPALAAYNKGERTSSPVAPYFARFGLDHLIRDNSEAWI